MSLTKVSIVIPVHNEGERLRLTLEALARTMPCMYDVIVVDDASTDGCCEQAAPFHHVQVIRPPARLGVAAARNYGARHAAAPMLLFLDGHCYPVRGWFERCYHTLRHLGRGIVGPCISVAGTPAARGYGMVMRGPHMGPEWLEQVCEHPYPVPMIGGCCMLLYRSYFDMLGGFDAMRVYGVEDTELCVRSWLLGYPVMVVPGAEVAHVFKEQTNFSVPWETYVFNSLRLVLLHFDGETLARLLSYWNSCPGYEQAWHALQQSDIWERREELRTRRAHDAEWYCRKFSITI